MASAAMDSARDQRKHNQNGQSNFPNRDKPLFRSRRPLQQQDFFTDSLNSSFIPQPSPPKNATGGAVGARPRRVLGGPRTLKAAFEVTANDAEEENRPQSSSSSDKNRSEQAPRPRPTQTNGRAPAEKTEGQPHQLTPSPPRGRSGAVVSPQSSASSPPRGLAEAYQRIIDEEDLAAQEGESVDDSTENLHANTHRADTRERDRRLVERMANSASPISLRSSRRGLPRASGRLEEIAAAEREAMETAHSMEGSDGDTSTNFLDNATDDSFGKTLMEHAKDQRRLNLALKSEGKIFSKARVGERVGLTVENLRRSNGSHEALDMALNHAGKGSVNSDRSEPPMNIPRGWGRKGSGGKDWLSRINSNSGRGRLTGDSPKVGKDKDPITTKAKEVLATEEDTDWTSAAAEVPLPSVEEGSSPHTSTSRASTPTSTPRRNSSLDKIRQWEMNEDDFTGRSLQISNSPPISIKNTTLDRIREREIETLERRAVTTSRLGELREKTSKEQLRRRSVSAPVEGQQGSPERTKDRTESRLSTSPENHHYKRPTIPEDEGEQVPNTPVTIYRGTKTGSDGSSDRARSDNGHRQENRRPSHERQDSHGLLRQLARASSASASPSPAKDFRDKHDHPTSKTEEQEVAVADPESEHDDPHDHEHETPKIRTTEGSDRTPEREPEDKTDATPQPIRQALPTKTPLITGAWVDTPLPTGGRGPPLPTPADLEDVRDLTFGVDEEISRLNVRSITDRPGRSPSRGRTTEPNKQLPNNNKPANAKSALAMIVDEAKRGVLQRDDDESPLGDDTIRSLEDLLADDTDVCTLLKLDDDNDASKSLQLQPSASGKPLTQSERERQTELLALERMNARLKALGLSIHDAKRGISKLAQQVCNEGGEFHDFIWPCEKCGCTGGRNNDARLRTWRVADVVGDDGGWQISIPVPRLWTWRQGERRPKLTWLGLFTLLAWVWVITEYVVCSIYCHPRYASSMVDYGVDITAPRAPFAAVTMFWRSPLGLFFKPFWYLLMFLVRLVARVLGYLDGFAGGGGGGGRWAGGVGGGRGGWGGNAIPRQPVSRDARIPRPVWGPDLSMMDDEYI